MNVADMTSAVSGWGPTAVLVGLVLGFFVHLGRSASPPANRAGGPAGFARDLPRAALAGMKRLHELQRRKALPPWDDLDGGFEVDAGPIRRDRDSELQEH